MYISLCILCLVPQSVSSRLRLVLIFPYHDLLIDPLNSFLIQYQSKAALHQQSPRVANVGIMRGSN